MNRENTLLLLFVFVLFVPGTIFAQKTATLKGVVKDAKTGEAMYSATVYFVGTSIGAITDERGKYIITGIPSGDYTIEIVTWVMSIFGNPSLLKPEKNMLKTSIWNIAGQSIYRM